MFVPPAVVDQRSRGGFTKRLPYLGPCARFYAEGQEDLHTVAGVSRAVQELKRIVATGGVDGRVDESSFQQLLAAIYGGSFCSIAANIASGGSLS